MERFAKTDNSWLLLTISQNAPSYTFDWVLNMFSGEFCEISKNSFLQNTSRRLLLKIRIIRERVEIKLIIQI